MTIRLGDSLTVREVAAARDAWLAALAGGGDPLVTLDAGELGAMDTAGAQLVLALRQECRTLGGRLTITAGEGVLPAMFRHLSLEV